MKEKQNLRQKTLNGLLWSFTELVANQGLQFIVLIILARLLGPEEFGLLGMVLIFVALSQTLVDSGFSQALIREKKVYQIDYSTTFFFNIGLSIVIYFLIYMVAPLVSSFYDEPRLTLILQIIGLVVFFQALSIVPKTILTRKVDFKTQMKVGITASIFSGLLAITMALIGLGVWSLILRIVIQRAVESLMFILINKWRPSLEFSLTSFNKFFNFGWKLLVSSLIDTGYKNIYYVIIGKMYTTSNLGFYTNARQFRDAINSGINSSIQRVTYPILSSIQTNEVKLKYGFKKLIRTTAYAYFPITLGIAAIGEQLIILLMGPQWHPAVIYFQLLCIAIIVYPLQAINLNILKVKGRSDLFLKLEIIKKLMSTIAIIIAIAMDYGVIGLIISQIITNHLALFINTFYSGKEINYGTQEQIKDIIPAYILSVLMALTVYFLGQYLNLDYIFIIVLQIGVGVLIYISVSRFFKLNGFYEIYNLIKPFINKI